MFSCEVKLSRIIGFKLMVMPVPSLCCQAYHYSYYFLPEKKFSVILVSYFLSSRQLCFQLKLFKLDRENKKKTLSSSKNVRVRNTYEVYHSQIWRQIMYENPRVRAERKSAEQ